MTVGSEAETPGHLLVRGERLHSPDRPCSEARSTRFSTGLVWESCSDRCNLVYVAAPRKQWSDVCRLLLALAGTVAFFAVAVALAQPRYLPLFKGALHPLERFIGPEAVSCLA